jgi:hypothetical protein
VVAFSEILRSCFAIPLLLFLIKSQIYFGSGIIISRISFL